MPDIKNNDISDCFYKTVFDGSNSKGIRHYEAMVESYASFEEGLKRYVQAYLACVNFVDEQVGLVLDALNNSRLRDNTIVILTSDHGYNQGEKDYLFKNSLWDESPRVPLIIKDPSVPGNGGKKVAQPVSLVDVYPTVLDYCGLTASNMKNDGGAPLSGFI
ncbi:sulfatase-like hydrolase/transferase [Marinilabilia rubra]|uniref:sulfatase-like hydrolase/transferase n=1 Tax=Marinilabilia rubra TaxID=2162893 RepID=UPI001E57B6D4|nr:sulfatase-like hydrolase/transferase [Marinilabilia rubra]